MFLPQVFLDCFLRLLKVWTSIMTFLFLSRLFTLMYYTAWFILLGQSTIPNILFIDWQIDLFNCLQDLKFIGIVQKQLLKPIKRTSGTVDYDSYFSHRWFTCKIQIVILQEKKSNFAAKTVVMNWWLWERIKSEASKWMGKY